MAEPTTHLTTGHLAAGKDADRARLEAASHGRDHGRRSYPRPDPAGEPVADHHGRARDAEAPSAAALGLADHLVGQRPRADLALNTAAGATQRLVGQTADARMAYSEAVHAQAAFDAHAPLAARVGFWPAWARWTLLLLMAVCGGANLAAGLLSVSNDDPVYALAYAAAVGAGLVGLGAATGHLLKRWELNRQRPAEHVAATSRVPVLVAVLGLAFVVALVAAVASVRATGAEADARREAGGSGALTIDMPGIEGQVGLGDPAASADPGPSIPAWTWGALEGVLVAGALVVEYAGHVPWAHHRAELERRAGRRKASWVAERGELAAAWARLKSAWDGRAAGDAGILVAGEATVLYAAVEVHTYRLENRAARADGGEDVTFEPLHRAGAGSPTDVPGPGSTSDRVAAFGGMPVRDQVAARWGLDLRPLGTVRLDHDDVDLDQVVPEVLARATAELANVPVRPRVRLVDWDPDAHYRRELDGMETAPPTTSTVVTELRPVPAAGGEAGPGGPSRGAPS